jgi:oligoendopeptidase F
MAATSRLSWTRLLGELCSAVRFEVDGEECGAGTILSLREDPDRALRRRAQEAFAAALEVGLPTRALAYNALLAGHAALDRLRGRSHWLDAKNRENEVSGADAQALIDAVIARYDIAQRWYRPKATLLGLDRLTDHDVMAPVGSIGRRYGYVQARELVPRVRTATSDPGDSHRSRTA